MSITEYALKNNRITLFAILLILVVSIGSFFSLSRSADPQITIRMARIVTLLPGASPERIEKLITDKIEKKVQEIPELDFISSESKVGTSIVLVALKEKYFDLRPIWDKLRRKVDSAKPALPPGVIGPFVNDEFGDVFGIIVSITGEDFSYAEVKDIADEVRDEFLMLDEVAKVDVLGAQEEQFFIEYDNTRLAEIGISPAQLAQILRGRNIIDPGGSISTGMERISIEPSGNYETIEDLGNTIIDIPGKKQLVYLRDLATIRSGYVDPAVTRMHANGSPALGVAVSMVRGENILLLGEKSKALVERINGVYPIGIEFEIVAFEPNKVEGMLSEFFTSLGQAILAVAFIALFALGIRNGLIVTSLMPMAILLGFIVMNLVDVGLHKISMAALMISLGLLVDNAVVMVESIVVLTRQGKTTARAAIESANELKIPLLTSSLTTSAAFLPQFLAESVSGEFTSALFKVVTITLLSSYVLTLTMIPLLCVAFLKTKDSVARSLADSYENRLYRGYRGGLIFVLKHRIMTLVVLISVFLVSMQGFGILPKAFFPKALAPLITVEIDLPVGAPIERTEAMVTDLENYMYSTWKADQREDGRGIANWASFIGSGGTRYTLNWTPEAPTPEYASMMINTTDSDVVPEVIAGMDQFIFQNYPDVTAIVKRTVEGPPVKSPVGIRLTGKEVNTLFEIADQVKQKLHSMPGTRDIADNWGSWAKKLYIRIDQAKARRAGISSQDIATSLQAGFSGINVTHFREDIDLIPVTLRSKNANQPGLDKLESMQVYSQSRGTSVPLSQVAVVEVMWEPAKIFRRDRSRAVTVSSELEEGFTSEAVSAELSDWLNEQAELWPAGYRFEITGAAHESAKASGAIQAKMPIGIMVIVALLIWQFNSFRKPLIILFTIPMSLIGVVSGLLLMDSYFGILTFLGIISLAGIVVNNAIVLLDRVNIEITENGMSPDLAIVVAAQRRLRPILVTTATTIGGLMPLMLTGTMFDTMAIAIVFGLLVATVLTLGFIPLLYSLFFKVNFKDFDYQKAVSDV
ncbi:MAG: efflux RND transporter permease subunit [Pseudomonadales bacterium]|nr:efflux RND transporter permease subunit [Pseudomonadales bacterium]